MKQNDDEDDSFISCSSLIKFENNQELNSQIFQSKFQADNSSDIIQFKSFSQDQFQMKQQLNQSLGSNYNFISPNNQLVRDKNISTNNSKYLSLNSQQFQTESFNSTISQIFPITQKKSSQQINLKQNKENIQNLPVNYHSQSNGIQNPTYYNKRPKINLKYDPQLQQGLLNSDNSGDSFQSLINRNLSNSIDYLGNNQSKGFNQNKQNIQQNQNRASSFQIKRIIDFSRNSSFQSLQKYKMQDSSNNNIQNQKQYLNGQNQKDNWIEQQYSQNYIFKNQSRSISYDSIQKELHKNKIYYKKQQQQKYQKVPKKQKEFLRFQSQYNLEQLLENEFGYLRNQNETRIIPYSKTELTQNNQYSRLNQNNKKQQQMQHNISQYTLLKQTFDVQNKYFKSYVDNVDTKEGQNNTYDTLKNNEIQQNYDIINQDEHAVLISQQKQPEKTSEEKYNELNKKNGQNKNDEQQEENSENLIDFYLQPRQQQGSIILQEQKQIYEKFSKKQEQNLPSKPPHNKSQQFVINPVDSGLSDEQNSTQNNLNQSQQNIKDFSFSIDKDLEERKELKIENGDAFDSVLNKSQFIYKNQEEIKKIPKNKPFQDDLSMVVGEKRYIKKWKQIKSLDIKSKQPKNRVRYFKQFDLQQKERCMCNILLGYDDKTQNDDMFIRDMYLSVFGDTENQSSENQYYSNNFNRKKQQLVSIKDVSTCLKFILTPVEFSFCTIPNKQLKEQIFLLSNLIYQGIEFIFVTPFLLLLASYDLKHQEFKDSILQSLNSDNIFLILQLLYMTWLIFYFINLILDGRKSLKEENRRLKFLKIL
ncbi:hypothetical protein PPERSA_01754 [Pseudocohnilembus persalinus]|uniref:Transmembrane protein n=1 Tax=Pseudocohnilembus persalinus TaxID=266149 RepID=A0A0V0R2A1_PSEPJ|nr:hypothetical protein PPERSA_01754 [Pseudocohnilembus persalinus]|eukprot:KRX08293.1 hypothetical protein PPERSA_01754 [Pseudocohnilembus persalinus]